MRPLLLLLLVTLAGCASQPRQTTAHVTFRTITYEVAVSVTVTPTEGMTR
jgi:hypothetical protein